MTMQSIQKYFRISFISALLLLVSFPLKAKGEPVMNDPITYNLTLKNQHGEITKMSDLKGKVVFINFWATWCPPCIAEMPNINKLYQQYQDDDQVVFLMISLDKKFDTAIKFWEQKKYDFDIQEPQNAIPKVFNTKGIPNSYVLGKDGEIEFRKMGMGNYNTQKFKDFLEELKAK